MSGVRERLGVPPVRGHARVTVALVVDALGTGLFLPFSVLYFLATTDLALAQVGLAVSLGAVVRLVAGPAAGVLCDRFSPRQVLLGANLLQGLGYLAYLGVTTLPALVGATVLIQAGNAAFWSSYSPLVAELSERGDRERWFGFLGTLRNTGFALGGLTAGAAVSTGGVTGYRALVLANALSYAAAAALLISRRRTHPRTTSRRPTAGSWVTVLSDRPYLGLTAANLSVATAELALSVVMPVWAVRSLGLPPWVPGAALTVNCVLVAAGQAPVVTLLTGRVRVRALQLAATLHIAAAAALLAAAAPPAPAAVVLVFLGVLGYTAAELVESPVTAAVSVEAAPDELVGRYLAVHQTSWNAVAIVGPAALTALLSAGGLAVWGALAAVAALGAAGITAVSHHVPEARTRVGAAT